MNRMILMLGVIFLIASVVSMLYTVTETTSNPFGSSTQTVAPYAAYAGPLGIIGVVLAIVGFYVRGD